MKLINTETEVCEPFSCISYSASIFFKDFIDSSFSQCVFLGFASHVNNYQKIVLVVFR